MEETSRIACGGPSPMRALRYEGKLYLSASSSFFDEAE